MGSPGYAPSAPEAPQSEVENTALAKLHEASTRLWRLRRLDEGLQEILTASIELLGADKGNVQLLDSKRAVLKIAAQQGFSQDFPDFFQEVAAADGSACGRALRSGKRVTIDDIEADPEFAPFRPIARASGIRAVQSTPLIDRTGKLLGVLSTHFHTKHKPSDQQLRLLDLYGQQASNFIERSRIDEQLRESDQRFQLAANSAPVLIWMSGTDKLCTWFNKRWLDFVGRTLDQELGDGWTENVHPNDFDACLKTYIDAFDARQSFSMEYRLRRTTVNIVGSSMRAFLGSLPILPATSALASTLQNVSGSSRPFATARRA